QKQNRRHWAGGNGVGRTAGARPNAREQSGYFSFQGGSQRTMLANGVLGSLVLFGSVQKHASFQYQRPLLPWRMMCSQVRPCMSGGRAWGRRRGGGVGVAASGLGGATS